MLEVKECNMCFLTKSVSEYYYDIHYNRYGYNCKLCHNKRTKISHDNYLKTQRGKQSLNNASKRARVNHPEKWIARAKLRYEVKKGNIKKPVHCETCDEIRLLQGHHDDYSKALEVKWLCSRCHANRHKELKEKI